MKIYAREETTWGKARKEQKESEGYTNEWLYWGRRREEEEEGEESKKAKKKKKGEEG